GVGDVFSLDVRIDDVEDLSAFQFGLAFNPLVLSLIGSSNGPFLTSNGDADFFIQSEIDGRLTFANLLLAAPAGVSGSGVLFSLEFAALHSGVSPVLALFDPDPVIGDGLFDSNFLTID